MRFVSNKLSLNKECHELREKLKKMERSRQDYKSLANESGKRVQEMRKKIAELETKHKSLQSRKTKRERKNQEKIAQMENRCKFHQRLTRGFLAQKF
jgi:hypothetical protein